ncbi:MAG: methyltransferase domain-containing protein [Pseudomonadota bacterium]
MTADAAFWDRIARKYAADPIKNQTAYEATLAAVRAHFKPSDRVLEIGCGTGSTALLLAGDVARYTGADISGGMIEIAREKLAAEPIDGLDFVVAPVNETRFDAGAYDAVLGFNILHLVSDLPAALARAHALLKPGGLYITKTPCLGDMGFHIRLIVPLVKLFQRARFHVGYLTAPGLEAQVADAGFDIVESRVFDGAKHARFLVARKR